MDIDNKVELALKYYNEGNLCLRTENDSCKQMCFKQQKSGRRLNHEPSKKWEPAKEEDNELSPKIDEIIVIGSHGRTGIDRLLRAASPKGPSAIERVPFCS